MIDHDIRAERGVPSLVWRAGQDRRLAMIRKWVQTSGMTLIAGCGIGGYTSHLLEDSNTVFSFDIEHDRARSTLDRAPLTHMAAGEAIPYPDNTFDLVLSHEVLEHVQDDSLTMSEMIRVLKPGGRLILFCPNRWYPFETHGHYWKGQYHFGNTPLINYLPDPIRNKLAPHVRAYTRHGLLRLLRPLPVRVVYHTRIFGAYDNIIKRRPLIGKPLRFILQSAEHTPLRYFGLSHLLVIEKENNG